MSKRRAILVIVTILGISTTANAQTGPATSSIEVLSIPDGQMACRIPPEVDDTFPKGVIAREFMLGKPLVNPFMTTWPREILVMFDSLGQTRFLTDEVTLFAASGYPAGSKSVVAIVVRDRMQATLMSIVVDSVALKTALAEGNIDKALATPKDGGRRPLSSDEEAKVRLLGESLWKRRCFP